MNASVRGLGYRATLIVALLALAAPMVGARPASERVTVTPVHGHSTTTFSVRFVSRLSPGRGETVVLLHPPRPSCNQRHPIGEADNIYTPGENRAPPGRTLTWRVGPLVHDRVRANGDFDIRLRYFAPRGKTGAPLGRWCAGVWRGRIGWSAWDDDTREYGRPVIYARFSYRVS